MFTFDKLLPEFRFTSLFADVNNGAFHSLTVEQKAEFSAIDGNNDL